MLYKPHTVTIKAESRDGAGGTSLGTSHTLKCQITPMAQTKAYEDWGVEVKRPHLLMADKSAAPYIEIGALVSWGSRRFKVSTTPAIYDFGYAADHLAAVIEEVDPAQYNA
jgi:hypothetical protein